MYLDNPISSLCSINRQGFGQFERVQITSYSLTIQFQNIFSNLKCSSIHIDAFITNIQTNKFEQTIQVKPNDFSPIQFSLFFSLKNIQTNTFHINQLFPNQNYSITIKISDEKNSRILPTHIFQTLQSSNRNSKIFICIENNLYGFHLALILTNDDLLSIEQIESFIFPHTHLYIVTLPSQIRRTSTILGNITLSYTINRKSLETFLGKQEFRRTDFGSRLLAAEGEGAEGRCG
jgi:hypothetical protein